MLTNNCRQLNSLLFIAVICIASTAGDLFGEEGVLADGAAVNQLADGFKFTEGPACDAEGNVYFTDQPNDRILCWSTDGKLTTFLQPCGRSNGLCFDADGNLWACADEKNELWRIAPDGSKEVVVKDFGGKDRQTLLITAKEHLFAVRTRVHGVGSQ